MFRAITQYIHSTEQIRIGYTPTTQDNTDIANGVWPTGLRSDAIHLNDFGYRIIGIRIADKINSFGW